MRLKLGNLPKSMVQHHNFEDNATRDVYMYVEIKGGVYGLLQAGLIAYKLLEKRLNKKVYHQSEITPFFWMHNWRLICISLCIDNFEVKYVGRQHM